MFSFYFIHSNEQNKKANVNNIQKSHKEARDTPQKCLIFGILGFLCIHACAVNVSLDLLELSILVLENSLNLHVKILREPC